MFTKNFYPCKMSTGIFINDINKNEIEVTDFPAAYEQAKICCQMHEEMKAHKGEEGVYYFEDAHKHWEYILRELEKLSTKHPSLLYKNL